MINKLSILLFVSLWLTGFHSFAQQVTTQVKITGIKSAKGNIVIAVFKDQQSFEKEQAYKSFTFDKKALANGNLSLLIKLDANTYGITLMDDENANGKIEKNMFGIPKEGFGFSNFFLDKLKRPVFNDFKVNLHTNQTKVDIKVKYM